ncbi:MAG: alpha/beta fold hydrolase [Parachlamydiales bacterium]|jgi:dipeptidyl aminopeptidase/acylaminoacyl peptidase
MNLLKPYLISLLFVFSFSFLIIEAHEVCIIPSSFPDLKIEVYFQKPSKECKKLLLFMHGSSGKGLQGISDAWFSHWLSKGYAVAAISMPGYGRSNGRKDFCGPLTIETLNHALEYIKKETKISELGVIGFGQGGLASLLLSLKRNDIRCLVCSNCGYDLLRHQGKEDPFRKQVEEKDYNLDFSDLASLKYRSAIEHIEKINTPLFLLHRKGNPMISEQEAIEFHNAMLNAGKECYLSIRERSETDDTQIISYEEVLIEAETWIDSCMNN